MKKILLLTSLFMISTLQAQFWTEKSTGFAAASRGINSISIVDANVIWAKAYDGITPGEAVREYTRSTNGGETWASGTMNLGIGTTALNISCITASSAFSAWVCNYSTTGTTFGGVWRTVNGGVTWEKQATALYNTADSFANIIHFWDGNNGVTQGDPANGYFEIYTTTNGGTNWSRVPSANIPSPLSGEYGYVNNFEVYGDIIWFGTNKGRIFKSINKGLNWTVSQSPISDFGSATISGHFTFSDANKGLLGGSDASLYSTNDGGVTWTPVTYTGPLGTNDLQYIPDTNSVVAIGSSPDFGSSYSLDNGLTWIEATAATQYTTLKFLNGTVGFAGAFNTNATTGGIYKYTGNVLSSEDFHVNTNVNAYPNPTKNTITVSGVDLNSAIIFDILGKQIASFSFNATNEKAIDLTNLSNGLYIMKVTNESGATQTVKIVKE